MPTTLESQLASWSSRSTAINEPPATGAEFQLEGRPLVPKRVLVVEDNIDSARTLASLVHEMGHKVEYAINGYAAIAAAKSFRPQIAILDLGLPGMSGFEVCRQLKSSEETRAIRILVLSAYGESEHRARSRALGCEIHLVKPVPPDVLEALLAD